VWHRGDVIRKWLERADLTSRAFADQHDIDKNTMTRLLRGEDVNTKTLEKVVAALDHTMLDLHRAIDPSQLLSDEDLLLVSDFHRAPEPVQAFVRDALRRAGRYQDTSEEDG